MRSIVEIGSSVPAFLKKLWKLVNDPETDHLISWGEKGKSFIIYDQAQFARDLLPLHYKHNNMASFIRQLNMYGFHKISSIDNVALRTDIEFTHQCFIRNKSYLLEHIKRKITNPRGIIASNEHGEQIVLKPELMTKVLSDVKQMKGKQESMDAKFTAIKLENEALWREVAILRQKHIKQQQIVNNLIQFLMSLVQPTRAGNANPNGVGVKRPYQLMINSAAHNSGNNKFNSARPKNFKLEEDHVEDGPTIHELAHDDILQSDDCGVSDFVTAELSDGSPVMNSVSPATAVPLSPYEVAVEYNDENAARATEQYSPQTETVPQVTSPSSVPEATNQIIITYQNDVPVITSIPSTSKTNKPIAFKKQPTINKNISTNNFNTIPTSTDLPAEIFDNDEIGYDEVVTDDNLQNILEENLLQPTPVAQDQMVGGINLKVDKDGKSYLRKLKKKSSKKPLEPLLISQIKTEKPDSIEETDWNNMRVATVNSPNRLPNMNRKDCYTKSLQDLMAQNEGCNTEDIDDHLDTMQTDIDSLRELLRSDSYSFDPNTIMGLFGNEDPLYGLSFNNILDDRSKPSNSVMKPQSKLANLAQDIGGNLSDQTDATNQLISYTGNVPDFSDIGISLPDLEGDESQEAILPSLDDMPSTLNTPQVTINSPFVPNVSTS